MICTHNLQADVSLETKLIKPNGIFYLGVAKFPDETKHYSDDDETDKCEPFLESSGCKNHSDSVVETSHIELGEDFNDKLDILIHHPKLLHHVLDELASSISSYRASFCMNEDCLGLLEDVSNFHDLLSKTKVDIRLTFLFDDIYGNHAAVDIRKIKCLAFIDTDSRGIDLKPEIEMISWIEYQDLGKIQAEILTNLQKLMRVGDNACNPSYGLFKMLWSRFSKILLVIPEEEDCSRVVPRYLGLVFSHLRRWDYSCMLHNDEQITKKWHSEDGLTKL